MPVSRYNNWTCTCSILIKLLGIVRCNARLTKLHLLIEAEGQCFHTFWWSEPSWKLLHKDSYREQVQQVILLDCYIPSPNWTMILQLCITWNRIVKLMNLKHQTCRTTKRWLALKPFQTSVSKQVPFHTSTNVSKFYHISLVKTCHCLKKVKEPCFFTGFMHF